MAGFYNTEVQQQDLSGLRQLASQKIEPNKSMFTVMGEKMGELSNTMKLRNQEDYTEKVFEGLSKIQDPQERINAIQMIDDSKLTKQGKQDVINKYTIANSEIKNSPADIRTLNAIGLEPTLENLEKLKQTGMKPASGNKYKVVTDDLGNAWKYDQVTGYTELLSSPSTSTTNKPIKPKPNFSGEIITPSGADITNVETTSGSYNKKFSDIGEAELPSGEKVKTVNGKVWLDSNGNPSVTGRVKLSQKEKESKANKRTLDTIRDLNNASQALGQAFNAVNNWSAGTANQLTGWIAGTPAKDLRLILKSPQAMEAFKSLIAMKESSPTGGALGSVTEKELELLMSEWANIDPEQSPQQLRGQMQRLAGKYSDIMDRIPKKYFDQYESLSAGINDVKTITSGGQKYKAGLKNGVEHVQNPADGKWYPRSMLKEK